MPPPSHPAAGDAGGFVDLVDALDVALRSTGLVAWSAVYDDHETALLAFRAAGWAVQVISDRRVRVWYLLRTRRGTLVVVVFYQPTWREAWQMLGRVVRHGWGWARWRPPANG